MQYGKFSLYQPTQYQIFRQHYKLIAGSLYFGLLTFFLSLLYYTTSRLQTISTLPEIFYTVSTWLVEKYPIEYPQMLSCLWAVLMRIFLLIRLV
jgi:hypothetical protein